VLIASGGRRDQRRVRLSVLLQERIAACPTTDGGREAPHAR